MVLWEEAGFCVLNILFAPWMFAYSSSPTFVNNLILTIPKPSCLSLLFFFFRLSLKSYWDYSPGLLAKIQWTLQTSNSISQQEVIWWLMTKFASISYLTITVYTEFDAAWSPTQISKLWSHQTKNLFSLVSGLSPFTNPCDIAWLEEPMKRVCTCKFWTTEQLSHLNQLLCQELFDPSWCRRN